MGPAHRGSKPSRSLTLLCWELGLAVVVVSLASPLAAVGQSAPATTTPQPQPAKPAAQSPVSLISDYAVGDLVRVQQSLAVGGKLKVVSGEKIEELPLQVQAGFTYEERLLAGDSRDPRNLRAARAYEQAEASITVAEQPQRPGLRADRRLVIVEGNRDQLRLYSPNGPLTREELDLIDVPGLSSLVDGLLPPEAVKPGDTWEVDPELWARLMRVDAVSRAEVPLSISELTAERAILSGGGVVHAGAGGVATEFDLRLKLLFDRKLRRVTGLGMAWKEKRSIGHVAPGLDVTAKLQMTILPVDQPQALTADVAAQLPAEPDAGVLQLVHQLPDGSLLTHDRDWYVLRNDSGEVVMRLVERGDLIAQCELSLLTDRKLEQVLSPSKLQEGIAQALGKMFGKFTESGQVGSEAGYQIQRVVVEGVAAELPIQWMYYVITDIRSGRELIMRFALEKQLLERFGSRDFEMATSFRFSERATEQTVEQASTQNTEQK